MALMISRCGAPSGSSRSIWSVAYIIPIARSRSKSSRGTGTRATSRKPEAISAPWRESNRPWSSSAASKCGESAQPVQVELAACPLRVTYGSNVRRQGPGKPITRDVWLVEVRVLGVGWEPWLLLTDWPVTDAQCAVRLFTMYRERWSVEDSFKFLKTCLGS